MAINTAPYVQAYLRFRRSLAQAVEWTDHNWTNSAITRQRFERIMAARSELLKLIPAAPEADPDVQIAEVLDGFAPKNADDVALQEAEVRKVETLLRAGRSLEQVILSAKPLRLAAIAQWIEVYPDALTSADPASVIAEVRELVFQQLVEAGVPEAVRVRDITADANIVSAWRDLLLALLEGAEFALPEQSRVARLDPEGFAALNIPDTVNRDVEIDYEVRRHDGLRLRRDSLSTTSGR